MKIGNYEIKRYDGRNLKLIKQAEREVKTQQVADMMNKRIGHSAAVAVGDYYNALEDIGFYPKLEMALERILDDSLIENIDKLDCDRITNHISLLKHKITEAIREQKHP
jgi:repressor of nif and glnA expression